MREQHLHGALPHRPRLPPLGGVHPGAVWPRAARWWLRQRDGWRCLRDRRWRGGRCERRWCRWWSDRWWSERGWHVGWRERGWRCRWSDGRWRECGWRCGRSDCRWCERWWCCRRQRGGRWNDARRGHRHGAAGRPVRARLRLHVEPLCRSSWRHAGRVHRELSHRSLVPGARDVPAGAQRHGRHHGPVYSFRLGRPVPDRPTDAVRRRHLPRSPGGCVAVHLHHALPEQPRVPAGVLVLADADWRQHAAGLYTHRNGVLRSGHVEPVHQPLVHHERRDAERGGVQRLVHRGNRLPCWLRVRLRRHAVGHRRPLPPHRAGLHGERRGQLVLVTHLSSGHAVRGLLHDLLHDADAPGGACAVPNGLELRQRRHRGTASVGLRALSSRAHVPVAVVAASASRRSRASLTWPRLRAASGAPRSAPSRGRAAPAPAGPTRAPASRHSRTTPRTAAGAWPRARPARAGR